MDAGFEKDHSRRDTLPQTRQDFLNYQLRPLTDRLNPDPTNSLSSP